ncbi:methyl-accepting chemotaxis protein [Dactylosporangium salmoneum]|uniref:Methyl-accepting chemotaxis protein n=1 Tax=Dactylosporangium salmoneum TaxID=53361 RepID=A0ABP5S9K3_9ACTN
MRRWLGSRRVSTKILIVAAVAIAGTAATGILALAAISDLRGTRDDEVGRAVPYISALNRAALAAKAAANDERGFLLGGDTQFRDEALGRQAAVNAAMQDAARTANAAETATLAKIQSALDAWFDALRTEFATYPADKAKATTDAFGANRDLRKVYEGLIDDESTRAGKALVAGQSFDDTVHSTRLAVIVLLGVAMVLAVALSLYIGRMIVQPLGRVSRVLRAVAGGDLTQDAGVDQGDEVGQMAGALRQATSQLRGTVATLAEHAVILAAASDELAVTSTQSAAGAEAGARQAGAVAGLADQMSTTIATVAAGATEMGASIREISQSASQAVTVAGRAVEVAGRGGTVMGQLGDSSAEIGNVIKLITSIAEQTNLLALNATIEAARAGDAGKGFAVVANEVKELAQETARATDDIGRRVAAIQSDTSEAVAAIEEIGEIIERINEYQTTIASAVEEQSATTEEMSRSVEEVSATGRQVAETIGSVASSVQLTTAGIGEANRAAGSLAELSGSLRSIVQTFRY